MRLMLCASLLLAAGLVAVVQASLIGSILANALLVLGLAFVVGGARHGVLHFENQTPRMIASLLLLAVSALMLPTLANELHLPAGAHEQELAVVCAVVLLIVFAVLTRAMLTQGQRAVPAEAHARAHAWPLKAAIATLFVCAAARRIPTTFSMALPAIATTTRPAKVWLRPSVSIAGSSVSTNQSDTSTAAAGKGELAVSVVLTSALQVAVVVVPILVLISYAMGGAPFTLVIPPILAAALFLSVMVVTVVTVDGEADMVDGAALMGLYVIIATIFWWG